MIRQFFRIFVLSCAMLSSTLAAAEMRVPQSSADIQLGFVPLVRAAAPAVVNIYARRVIAQRTTPFFGDPFFRNFFGDFAQSQPRVQNSLGSGVVLSADGFVVSNYHVVGQATDIRVVLTDRREFNARVLLADEDSDLAILKLDGATDMPFLTLRNSDEVEVGELVLAIGNPFGVGQTVTSGIVSGLARSGIATGNSRGYFIQTDAAINPGNSGGALIDVNGNLIGVNTSILTRSGGSNGIGFAIPANLVAQFVAQAQSGARSFSRPWAGLNGQPVDADIAASLRLDVVGGIVISDIHPASPFLSAGFSTGDVILAVDGQMVNTPAEMIYRMSAAGLGATVTVTRIRDGRREDRRVQLMAPPDAPAREPIRTTNSAAIPGLELVNINPSVLAEFDLPLSAEGVVVSDPGPIGERAGLRQGDIMRAANGVALETTRQAWEALHSARGRLVLDMQRGTQRMSIRLRI